MKIGFHIEGEKQLQKQLGEVARALGPDAVEKLAIKCAEIIVEDSRRRAPEDTGTLKKAHIAKLLDRWGANPAPAVAKVNYSSRESVPAAPHAHLVEWGTSKMAARPYFRPAVDSKGPVAAKRLREGLRRLVEEAAK